MDKKERVERVKVVLIGENNVGKTEIISNFTKNPFELDCAPMSGSEGTKTLKFDEFDKSINFELWDSPSEEKYISVSKIYYKGANAIIFVYDITSRKSFILIKSYWYEKVKSYCNNYPILAIVGNKSDNIEEWQVSEEEGKEFARSINAIFHLNSRDSYRIEDLFVKIGLRYLAPNYYNLLPEIKGWFSFFKKDYRVKELEILNEEYIKKIEEVKKN